MEDFSRSLTAVLNHTSLKRDEARAAFASLLDQSLPPEKISAFLIALKMKGETADEIAGFADCLSGQAVGVSVKNTNLVDVCGTGGDRSGTFNVSTTVAFVLAGAGQSVAKHGNRSVSSQSGSFDLLEALGIKFNADSDSVRESIETHGVAFLFAPAFHPVLKNLAQIRRNLGVSTVLNILGPLLNPVLQLKRQVLGVYSPHLVEKLAHVLLARGAVDAMVVHGHDAIDEFSLAGPTQVSRIQNGAITHFEVHPTQFGLRRASLAELRGGTPAQNAQILRDIFRGERGPRRDVVLLNAAAALMVGGRARDFADGIEIAEASIDSGAAMKTLEGMRA